MNIPELVKDLAKLELSNISDLKRTLNNYISKGLKLYVKLPDYKDVDSNYMLFDRIEIHRYNKSILLVSNSTQSYTLEINPTLFSTIKVKDALGRFRSIVTSYERDGKVFFDTSLRVWEGGDIYFLVPSSDVRFYDFILDLVSTKGNLMTRLEPVTGRSKTEYYSLGIPHPIKTTQVIQFTEQCNKGGLK